MPESAVKGMIVNMNIIEKIIKKQNSNFSAPGVSIVFFGDSVTQGCFELYTDLNGEIQTVFDKNHTYHGYLAKIFSILYPSVPINFINSGISGDNSVHACERLERDVLSYKPDLVVVCFGLNDATRGKDEIAKYTSSLEKIFDGIKKSGGEVIFMTPNMMSTSPSPHTTQKEHIETCKLCTSLQNDGVMDLYIDAAKKLCHDMNVTVCDCYAKWKLLYECGVNTTELLANKCNHPTREMNWLFAYSLAETILTAHKQTKEKELLLLKKQTE